MITEVAPRPTSNYDAYLDAVRVAITQEPKDWTFKSDPGYRTVLEHVSPGHGGALLMWARAAEPELHTSLIEQAAQDNDSLGTPITFDGYSPSNWRYLAHAIRVWQHIDSLGWSEIDIIELGGGYGGLALYVDALRYFYRTSLQNYTIVDLPEVAELQQRYVAAVGIPAVHAINGLDTTAIDRVRARLFYAPAVVVSAYAFSEFDQETRDWYAERLIRHCDHGIIWWNFPEPVMGDDGRTYGGPVYPFIDKPLTIEDDDPRIYPGHKIVRW